MKSLQLNLDYIKIAIIETKTKKLKKIHKKNVNESVIWEGFRNI